ncbi:alpha/beta fold hydrolase [Pararhodobacter sp.]|uniref:alpha/beta fold hydrolase n=1 Tax=Pararhodobacter sp. TaxID=2127056 RepID=UPI002FE30914
MNLLSKIAISAALSLAISGGIALGLIASDRPVEDLRAEGGGLDFSALSGSALPDLQRYRARDGAELGYRRWDAAREDAMLVVAVHGSGWHGAQFARLGAGLAAAGFDVVAPDLRGHGPAPARRGDIDYIGQFEADLADLIADQARPGQRVAMLGHSSGGGLVIRFAGGDQGALIERAVLLAPFVQYDAPTARPESGGWARVMTRRIIGLTMLNAVGIRVLNHLPVIQFRFPDSVLDGPQGATATRAYSFRLNTSYAPRRDWRAEIAALPPFLLLAGRADEAFLAEAYEPTFSAVTDRGQYALTGASHLSVVDDPETLARVAAFLNGG